VNENLKSLEVLPKLTDAVCQRIDEVMRQD
jgi:hypothetical protein